MFAPDIAAQHPAMTPLKQIRVAIGIVIAGLVVSGVTAFPLPYSDRQLNSRNIPRGC